MKLIIKVTHQSPLFHILTIISAVHKPTADTGNIVRDILEAKKQKYTCTNTD